MYKYGEYNVESCVIAEELNNNFEKNELFFGYPTSTIDAVKEALKNTNDNDIVVELNKETLERLDKHACPYGNMCRLHMYYGTDERVMFWNHLIALLIMKQLENQYHFNCGHDLDEEEKYFTEKTYEEYAKVADTLVTREDVFKTIQSLCLNNPRLHILSRYSLGEESEIDNYLQDEYPFVTMVYSDGDTFKDVYNYCHLVEYEDGGKYPEKNKYRLFYQDNLVEDSYGYHRKGK